jgi:hypothetical protein
MQQHLLARQRLAAAPAAGRAPARAPARPAARAPARARRAAAPRAAADEPAAAAAAADGEEAAFEARLAALKRAKGQTPAGEGAKAAAKATAAASASSPAAKPFASKSEASYAGEELFFETGPHVGDLAVNVALGTTLVWLPLTAAAVGRAAFVKYRFTDRRLSVITSAPWQQERLDADYRQVTDVVSIGRGARFGFEEAPLTFIALNSTRIAAAPLPLRLLSSPRLTSLRPSLSTRAGLGYWGDVVVRLAGGDSVEMRAVPRHKELREYILARRDALLGVADGGAGGLGAGGGGGEGGGGPSGGGRGFA